MDLFMYLCTYELLINSNGFMNAYVILLGSWPLFNCEFSHIIRPILVINVFVGYFSLHFLFIFSLCIY